MTKNITKISSLASGDKHGFLTFIRHVEPVIGGMKRVRARPRALWKCDCGAEKIVDPYPVLRGTVSSCGCFRTKQLRKKIQKYFPGDRFGRLVILKTGIERGMARVKCDCGVVKDIQLNGVVAGKVRSCGCFSDEVKRQPKGADGDTRRNKCSKYHGVYKSWSSMMERCYSEKSSSYKSYGGRGIEVHEDWHDYISFKAWALTNGWERGLTIERINVHGGYNPGNCEWIRSDKQNDNKRNTVLWFVHGQEMTLREACQRYSVVPSTIVSWCKGYISRQGRAMPPREGCYFRRKYS